MSINKSPSKSNMKRFDDCIREVLYQYNKEKFPCYNQREMTIAINYDLNLLAHGTSFTDVFWKQVNERYQQVVNTYQISKETQEKNMNHQKQENRHFGLGGKGVTENLHSQHFGLGGKGVTENLHSQHFGLGAGGVHDS